MANTILQQTSLELIQHIETELLENPALDILEDSLPCQGDCVDPSRCPYCSQRQIDAHEPEVRNPKEPYEEEEFYSDGTYETDDDYDPLSNIEAELTLEDYLRGLVRAAMPEEDYFIGDYIVSCLDDNGWLSATTEDISAELKVNEADVCRVLKVIQGFDPPGVA